MGIPKYSVEEVKKYKVYIRMRAEGKENFGNAIYFGVYSHNQGQTQLSKPVALAACNGKEYKVFSLPAGKMDNNIAIWISPGNRPENELKYIYIDNITLIREE